MMMGKLILASSSPRRRELLGYYGYKFEVISPAVDEEKILLNGKSLQEKACAVSLEKAISAIDALSRNVNPASRPAELSPDVNVSAGGTEEYWLLSADTIVVLDGEIIGKPKDRTDAFRILSMLSSRIHEVITAWHLLPAGGGIEGAAWRNASFSTDARVSEIELPYPQLRTEGTEDKISLAKGYMGICRTKVGFRSIKAEEIEWYIGTGEPMDKAGAYGAQGYASLFINYIEGPFSNVIGLPIEDVAEALSNAGIIMEVRVK